MTKLNQVIAVEKTIKARAHTHLTGEYQKLQKAPLLAGQTRTYQPLNDEGETLPSEAQRVQLRVVDSIESTTQRLTELFDVTATKDWANCSAKADVVVDGETVLSGVPATYLLFLEKQLVDLHAFVSKLPTLDAAEEWQYDNNTGLYKTGVTKTLKTRKTPRVLVKAEATKEHPAQVETYFEDVPTGTWYTTKVSGALPSTRVQAFVDRLERLQRAVKHAREEANMQEVTARNVGEDVFKFLFGS
jgi:hypothetical protein